MRGRAPLFSGVHSQKAGSQRSRRPREFGNIVPGAHHLGRRFRIDPVSSFKFGIGNLRTTDKTAVDQDKNKSAGVLYPAAQLIINSDGELQIELRKNPWRLSNIIMRGKGAE